MQQQTSAPAVRCGTPLAAQEPGTPSGAHEALQGFLGTGRPMVTVAAVLGALAVAAGAFGAHALKKHASGGDLAIWETAARYHLLHAAVLLAIALGLPERRARLPFGLLSAGVVLFSGSLYALVLSGSRGLGVVTPVGGLLLIAGWLSVAWSGTRTEGTSITKAVSPASPPDPSELAPPRGEHDR